MSSEIPVVLKPQGFAETKQGADAAAGSLANLGTKVVSLEKLGEAAKKIGPAALAMTSLAFAGREAGRALNDAFGGVVEQANAAARATVAVREAVRSARAAALDSGRSAIAGNGPVLAQAAAAGVSTPEAAAAAKKYGVSLDEARKALANGGDLEAADALRTQTGESLDSASSKIFKQFRGAKVGANGASAILAQSGQFLPPGELLRAKDAVESDPLVKKQRELNSAAVDKQVDKEGRALAAPTPRARSEETEAALAKARLEMTAADGTLERRERLLKGYNSGGTLDKIVNFFPTLAALSGLALENKTGQSAADSAVVEAINQMRREGMKTIPVNRDAVAQ